MTSRLSTAIQDSTRPGVRQLASTLGLAIALVYLAFVPHIAIDPVSVVVAIGIVAIATVAAFAVPWQRVSERWTLVLPLASLLAFGIFRLGTGGSQSVFAALLILPVVWIAAERGRASIAVAAVGTAGMMALPYLLGTEELTAAQGARVLFAPLVFAMLAAVVNELAAQSRRQLAAVTVLADERAQALSRAEASSVERAAVVARLGEAEAFHRSVWQAIRQQAVVITDTSGRIVEWGPGAERLLESSRDEAIGRTALDYLQLADHGRVQRLDFDSLLSLARDEEIADGLELRTPSGVIIPVDVTYSPRVGPGGETKGFILVAHDMRQTREAARLKDDFVGTVSHELRTPLSSVLGYLELARDDEAGLSDTQAHYLAVADRNARRLLALVGDLLFVAQVDAGRFPLELERVDVGRIIASSAESARPAASAAGVAIAFEAPERTLVARADGMRLGQAIDNLLSNAIKFTPAEGTVTISLVRRGDELRISISDTGVGIPADEMERLFSRFFRSTTSTRQAVQGVGLGLNITRAIVDAHGGRIEASSVDGVGTTFEIWIPALGD